MAKQAENEAPRLPELFDKIWKLYEFIDSTAEPTVSSSVQEKISEGIEESEKAVLMINQLNLFSANEDIEEVATNEIRFMLMPALLAYFTGKSMKQERKSSLEKEQEYLLDFLKLCKHYGVKEFEIPKSGTNQSDVTTSPAAPSTGPPSPAEMKAMADKRKQKVERFKERKQLESKLKELHEYVQKEHVDDELKREYWLTVLKQWINNTFEELQSIEDEVPLLEHMAKLKLKGASNQNTSQEKVKKKPMRPFIITKDVLQKQVFGAGYASLPTFTVEEFFENQVKEGKIPDPHQQTNQQVVQGYADGPSQQAAQQEEEDVEKERKEENDDEESIQKAREWDDWTDDHRRGWGNTQNKG